jgi:hypothetical protein
MTRNDWRILGAFLAPGGLLLAVSGVASVIARFLAAVDDNLADFGGDS